MWTQPTATAEALAAPAAKPRGLSLRIIFNAMRRHTLALFGVFVLAGTVAACIWLFLPLPKKTAAVSYYIAPSQPTLLNTQAADRTNAEAYRRSQVELVRQRRTLNAVLNNPQVKSLAMLRAVEEDKLAWLEKNISIDSRGGADYLRITVEGDQDKELLVLIEAVGKAYIEVAREREDYTRTGRLADLTKEHTALLGELKQFDIKIGKLASDLGGTDEFWLATTSVIRQRLVETAVQDQLLLQGKLDIAAKKLEVARAVAKAKADRIAIATCIWAPWHAALPQRPVELQPGAVETILASDPKLRELETAVVVARENADRYSPESMTSFALDARAKVTTAEAARDTHRARVRADLLARLEVAQREKHDAEDASIVSRAERDYDLAKSDHDQAGVRIADLMKDMKKYSDAKADLDVLKREMKVKETLAAKLASDCESLRVELKAPQRIQQHDEPYIVTGLEGNRRLKFAMLASIATLGLGFAGLVFWEYRSRRVTHTDEVSTDLGARLLGTIPPLAPVGRTPGPAHSDLVEAIDTTRIMLMHGSPLDGDVRVLLVTSAVAGEGKTTLSGNLAISLTRAGFRTLLVDGDTRAPTAHNLFNLADAPGLGELLREEADLDTAVRSSPIPGLSVLPAGTWTAATYQMLVGNQWRQIVRRLKDEFDYVVIDTSPLLLVSDTMLLAREADGVVLSVMLGVSQIARVAETVSRLQTVGARLSGVVVNNVRAGAAQHADAYRAKYYVQNGAALLSDAGVVEETDSQPKNG